MISVFNPTLHSTTLRPIPSTRVSSTYSACFAPDIATHQVAFGGYVENERPLHKKSVFLVGSLLRIDPEMRELLWVSADAYDMYFRLKNKGVSALKKSLGLEKKNRQSVPDVFKGLFDSAKKLLDTSEKQWDDMVTRRFQERAIPKNWREKLFFMTARSAIFIKRQFFA